MFGRITLVTSAVFAGSLLASAAAYAADTVKPAVLYDLGGKFDKSFNEGVFNGATRFTKETGIKFRDLEIQNEAQREQVLRKFAKDGYSPIMTVGFAWETALKKVAPEYPKTDFGIIDDVVDLPNVQSIVFKEQEGSFVVGVIAAKTTKTGKVGFVGGMDIPLISKFQCGYAQGVKYASDGKDEVFANMTGTTPAAWNDPVKGGELAKSQIDRGADIVYAAAGATGQGVLKAAADAGKFGIGVDSNQNGLFPGACPDLDAEARRRRHLRFLHGREERKVEGRRRGARAQGRRRRLRGRQEQRKDSHPRGEGCRGPGREGHHLGQDPGPRLHVRQQVPGVREARLRRGRRSPPVMAVPAKQSGVGPAVDAGLAPSLTAPGRARGPAPSASRLDRSSAG